MEALIAAGQGNAAAKAAAKLGLEDTFPGLSVAADQGLIGRLLTKRKWGIAFLMASKPEQQVCLAQDLLLQPQSPAFKQLTSGCWPFWQQDHVRSSMRCRAGQSRPREAGLAKHRSPMQHRQWQSNAAQPVAALVQHIWQCIWPHPCVMRRPAL